MWDWAFIGWAFAASSVIAAVIGSNDKRLEESKRESVSLWLMAGTNRLWATEFIQLFDLVMGPVHFSIRRVISSAIATIIAVTALYILMEPVLGLMSSRTDAQIGWVDILIFAALINIIADYISLIETRWLLGRLAHWQNWFLQLLLLAFDLIISTIIIYAAISAFRWLNGDDLFSPLEMVAGYTPFAIFFYSTFLTSIWAWAFCLSAWTIRFFVGLKLFRWLSVTEFPFFHIGTFAGVIVFCSALAAKPLVERFIPDDVDNWLCLQFEGKICSHAARLTDDDAAKIENLKRACITGDAKQCKKVLDDFSGELSIEATPYLEAACNENSEGVACNTLGYMNYTATAVEQDFAAAKRYFRQGCDFGVHTSCSNLGRIYENGLSGPKDYEKARMLYKSACEGQNANACSNLAYMYALGRGGPVDPLQQAKYFKAACVAGHTESCEIINN